MMNKWILFLFPALLSITSCSDKLDLVKLTGTYQGNFIYRNQSRPAVSGPVTITFTQNAYLSSGNPDRIPAGGSGIFEPGERNQIKFEDQNFWTADFDWGLILSGSYKYKIKGDSLILKKEITQGGNAYEYRLKRTE